MSKPAPAITSKWLAPIKPEFVIGTRRDAQSIGWAADAMAQEMFSRALDQLTVEEGFKLRGRIDVEIAERRRGPKADGPHDVQCVGCGHAYRCFCDYQHQQGECHYCHENTTPFQDYRRIRRGGDPLD